MPQPVPDGGLPATTLTTKCNAAWKVGIPLIPVDEQMFRGVQWTVLLCPAVKYQEGSNHVHPGSTRERNEV